MSQLCLCPADVDPALASQAFDGLAAALVSQYGNPMLRVLGGQLKSASGDAFVHQYLENLSAKTRDGVGLPCDTEQLGGHVVAQFNVPLTAVQLTCRPANAGRHVFPNP